MWFAINYSYTYYNIGTVLFYFRISEARDTLRDREKCSDKNHQPREAERIGVVKGNDF